MNPCISEGTAPSIIRAMKRVSVRLAITQLTKRHSNNKPPAAQSFMWTGGVLIRAERSGLFLFHRHGDGAGGRQANLVAFDIGNQAPVDVEVMPLVGAFADVLLGELDPVALDPCL